MKLNEREIRISHFVDRYKLILKFTEKGKRPRIPNAIFKKRTKLEN